MFGIWTAMFQLECQNVPMVYSFTCYRMKHQDIQGNFFNKKVHMDSSKLLAVYDWMLLLS